MLRLRRLWKGEKNNISKFNYPLFFNALTRHSSDSHGSEKNADDRLSGCRIIKT